MNKCSSLREVAKYLLQDPEFKKELQHRDDMARQVPCTQPHLGCLIELQGFDDLMWLLALSDAEFMHATCDIPLGDLDASSRRQILADLDVHYDECEHCRIVSHTRCWLDQRFAEFIAESIEGGYAHCQFPRREAVHTN